MLESPALSFPPVPFFHYPEEEYRRKKKQQINRNQRCEADADQGIAVSVAVGRERPTSLPHWIVAIPQVRTGSTFPARAEASVKRQSAR